MSLRVAVILALLSNVSHDQQPEHQSSGSDQFTETAEDSSGQIFLSAGIRLPWPVLEGQRVVTRQTKKRAIVAVDPNSGKWRVLTFGSATPEVRVSPNGKVIAYTQLVGPQHVPETWIYDIGNKQATRLSELGGSVCWSPDGTKIVVSIVDKDSEKLSTWLLRRSGERLKQLSIRSTDQVQDWSADGRWMVVTSTRKFAPDEGYGAQLYRVNADLSEEKQLTDSGHNVHPRISPDGKHIVYLTVDLTRKTKRPYTLRLVNADGTDDRQLLAEDIPKSVYTACWSPDGDRLAVVMFDWKEEDGSRFFGGVDSHWRIAVIDPDSGKRRVLTLVGEAEDTFIESLGEPDWR